MREILRQYAAGYAKSEEQLTLMEDDQSSIHYPEVYLFIGDKTASAIEPIMEIQDRKWDNSASVVYFLCRHGPERRTRAPRLRTLRSASPIPPAAAGVGHSIQIDAEGAVPELLSEPASSVRVESSDSEVKPPYFRLWTQLCFV